MAIISRLSVLSISFVLLFSGISLAQSKNDKVVVGKVGNEKITYGELKTNYNTSASGPFTLTDLEEFLPIYLDYRAKLKSAREEGYFSDPDILAEYTQYAKQAAYAYWLEKKIKPVVFDEYYKRAQDEFKAFHVLVEVQGNAPQSQIDDAVKKLQEARQKMMDGTPLEEVNQEYSSVRNGRSMGGTLPWFSVGRTVKEFEDEIYNLEIGEVSEPFRTQFGYHVVTLLDKRERTSARKVHHIFVRPATDSSDVNAINEAYKQLEEGRNWDQVVTEYSQDDQSKRNKGLIGWMNYGGNFAEPLIDAVMKLDPEKDFSEPVRTSYGYHIFKIDSVQTYATEEDKKEVLMKELENSPYFKRNNGFAVDYLKKEFGTDINKDRLSELNTFISQQDTIHISDINIPSDLANVSIYTFDGQEYTISDYYGYLEETRPQRKASDYSTTWNNDYIQYLIDNQIVEITTKKFPEFKNQTDSYINGLVVYEINDDSVWSSATVDSTKLRAVYNKDTERYTYKERPFYYLISNRADSTLNKIADFIREGNSPDSIRAHFSGVLLTSDSTNTFQNEPYNRLEPLSENSFSEIFDYNNRRAIFYLKKRLPARKMTFEEAFNRILSDYQPEREASWMEGLRDTYSIKVDYKNLKKAYQKDTTSAK